MDEKSTFIDALANKLYAELLGDVVDGIIFEGVKSVKRARQLCSVCHSL